MALIHWICPNEGSKHYGVRGVLKNQTFRPPLYRSEQGCILTTSRKIELTFDNYYAWKRNTRARNWEDHPPHVLNFVTLSHL